MRYPIEFARCALLSGLVLVVTPPANAQEPAPAEDQVTNGDLAAAEDAFWKGKHSYDEGAYADALVQFQAAYRLTHDPDVLYNIAQTYRRMGKCVLARDAYRSFTLLAPQSPLAAQAESLAASCSEPRTDLLVSPTNKQEPLIIAPSNLDTNASNNRSAPHDVTLHSARSTTTGLGTTRTWGIVLAAGGVVAGGIATGLALWNRDRYQDWQHRDQDLIQGPMPNESNAAWLGRQTTNDQSGQSIQRVDREVRLLSVSAGVLVVAAGALLVAARYEDVNSTKRARPMFDLKIQPSASGLNTTFASVTSSF